MPFGAGRPRCMLQAASSGSDDVTGLENSGGRPRQPGITQQVFDHVGQVAAYLIASLCLALFVIGWESVIGEHALASRQTRTRIVALRKEEVSSSRRSDQDSSNFLEATTLVDRGRRTVQGMGFGREERQLLASQQEAEASILLQNGPETKDESENAYLLLPNRPSYNEVMERHRHDTVSQWKLLYRGDTTMSVREVHGAIHDVRVALESVEDLKRFAASYEWENLRDAIRSRTWQSDLNRAASLLGQVRYDGATPKFALGVDGSSSRLSSSVGFDWGSCAWRHQCGPWADWQESIDQIDALLGVLEPHEVLFCIDIVERSVREVLAAIPPALWDPSDWSAYQAMPPYRPYASMRAESDERRPDGTGEVESDVYSDPYIQALLDLRID